jgi:hypothetical protein
MTRPWGTRLLLVVVFAIAMGWLEAVVVVYIREILGIARDAVTYPAEDEMMARLRDPPWLLLTEQSREAATLIMLTAVAWLAGSRWRSRFGAFLVSFGVWDIVYYIALYVLLRWPPSLATLDLLFLIPPHPGWYQPVWVPVAISCGMIATGVLLFRRDERPAEPRAG